jgi:hypothetical protein
MAAWGAANTSGAPLAPKARAAVACIRAKALFARCVRALGHEAGAKALGHDGRGTLGRAHRGRRRRAKDISRCEAHQAKQYVYAYSAAKAEHEVQRRFLLNVVIRKRALVLELLAGKDEALLVRGNALLVLNFLLDLLNCVGWFHIQSDCLARQSLDENLHAATEAQHEVQRRLFLDVVVAQRAPVLELLAGENQTLLVRGNALLVLNFLLDALDRVGWFHIQSDCLARQSLDKDLHGLFTVYVVKKTTFLACQRDSTSLCILSVNKMVIGSCPNPVVVLVYILLFFFLLVRRARPRQGSSNSEPVPPAAPCIFNRPAKVVIDWGTATATAANVTELAAILNVPGSPPPSPITIFVTADFNIPNTTQIATVRPFRLTSQGSKKRITTTRTSGFTWTISGAEGNRVDVQLDNIILQTNAAQPFTYLQYDGYGKFLVENVTFETHGICLSSVNADVI